MSIKGTTTTAAARRPGGGASRPASPAGASRARSGWAATAGWLFDRDWSRQLLSLGQGITAGSWSFPRSARSAAAPCTSRRGLRMSNARSGVPDRETHRGMARVASRRGRLPPPLPGGSGEARSAQATVGTAAGIRAWNGASAFHMACSTTPILRATAAAAARSNPRRWTSPSPHAFSVDGRRTRASRQAAASNRCRAAACPRAWTRSRHGRSPPIGAAWASARGGRPPSVNAGSAAGPRPRR